MRTFSIALLSFALSLCAATQAQAEAARAGQKARQLSDTNLFEVHLHNPASSHKRLPSEMRKDHHERDEMPDASSKTATIAAVAGPVSTSASTSSAAALAKVTFTPRQPSHFIKHRRQKHSKRRLSDVLPAQVTLMRDSDDFSSVWANLHNIQSMVASIAVNAHETSEQQLAVVEVTESRPESEPSSSSRSKP